MLSALAPLIGRLPLLWVLTFGSPPAATGAPAGPADALRSGPLEAGPAAASQPRFVGLPPAQTGVDFVYHWNRAPKYERLFNSSAVGGGVGVGDYDGDGLPDLCLTRPSGGCQLYRNLGGFRFTNVTERAGLHDDGSWTTGVTFVDINNDGRLDLYVCCYDGPNRLYVNQGDGTFAERAHAYGLDFNGASIMAAFGDYDLDGRLDCYLLTGGLMPNPSQRFRVKFVDGRPTVPEELQEFWQIFYLPGERAASAEAGQFDHLFHQNADGTFTDVSRSAGIVGCDFGNAVLWWDFNADGWPDLYVANDYFGPDRLYRNNGDGTFTDVTRAALPHTPWTSMGADAADINNDGLMDLIASDMSGTTRFKRIVDMGDMERSGWFLDLAQPRQYMRNALYLNTGTPRFMEVAHLAGLANTDWTWSILFGDLDNDGWVDVFVPNGMTRDWMDNDLAAKARGLPPAELMRFWQSQPVRADHNLAFRNRGQLRFENTTREWGLDHPGPSFGAVLADLDRDGRLDLVVNDFEAPARVYRNAGRDGHRLTVRLSSPTANRYGIGATIRVRTVAGTQMRYLTLSHGFMSAGEPVAQFGLGDCDRIEALTVEWPSRRKQTFEDLPADRWYAISEPETEAASPPPRPSPPAPLFVRSTALADARHEEAPLDESRQQPLLPWRLSEWGPGLAWADVDGDGNEDLYVSGTPRRPGRLYRNRGGGKFSVDPQSGVASQAEEAAPLFFDANGDGHPDLLVVTGSRNEPSGAEPLRDRLYLNDGKGRFTLALEGSLPDRRDNGSTAVAADFDRDGDLDLFVGSRSIPGAYPRTPASRLLRNEGGRFTDVTDDLAPGLRLAGLVTGAIWSDVDNDGWVDLLVTCEWGPVRLFHNDHGRLVERTRESGLAERLGWWTGISAADVDGDGSIDFLVTNLGLNTRYQPTVAAPSRLYFGDFDGTGEPKLLEAMIDEGRWVPRRGRSALAQVMPGLLERFPSHHDFATAALTNLVPGSALDAALVVEATTAESGLLLNDGKGRFTFRALPRAAQAAPAFGSVLVDLNGDGHADVYLVQNFAGAQRETGRMDGGVSLLLLGRGDGTFEPVWPDRSGLVVGGEGRSVTCADLNGDGWPDLVVGIHDDAVLAFENHSFGSNRALTVQLQGRGANRAAIGARVTLRLQSGVPRTAEVYAGGGYLSQSGGALRFGLGPGGEPAAVEVRWPDGRRSVHTAGLSAQTVRIVQP